MKISLLIIASFLSLLSVIAQEKSTGFKSSSERLLAADSRLSIGGYAQIDYNQPLSGDVYRNGILDVHRMVLLFGYKFNDRAQFVSEIEIEHSNEFFLEQAFLNYRILPWLHLRGGLMLIPMGIINEYHEPPLYNGVERPSVDNLIVPTTWREMGVGFTGTFNNTPLKYQVYLFNGFRSYNNGTSYLAGSSGLRNGRQRGIQSYMSSPNLSAKLDYFGISGLKVGLAGYIGDTQSTLYNNLDKDNDAGKAIADSSVVGVTMIGLDSRYVKNGWEFRGQYIMTFVENSAQYNEFTGRDLGSRMYGWYLEAGYNVFQKSRFDSQLVPFIRFEKYDTQNETSGGLARNLDNNINEVTAGIGWRITTALVLKGDYTWHKSELDANNTNQINLGIGLMF